MKAFHIIGQPGSGKTTLMVDIVKRLRWQNISVGTIKHSAHAHELDKPGKDSFLHRTAGAAPAATMTRDIAAVYLPRPPNMTPATLMEHYYAHLIMSSFVILIYQISFQQLFPLSVGLVSR